MTGKITVILLIVITLIFGIVFFYFQTYAYYSKVDSKEQIIVNKIQIKVEDYIGIRSDVSKLKLRGCKTKKCIFWIQLLVVTLFWWFNRPN